VAPEQGRNEALEERLGDTSIVVLPFTNLSADPDQEFFADGMAEELLNLPARIPELRVISRTSAFAFKGKDVGVAEIAARVLDALKLELIGDAPKARRTDPQAHVPVMQAWQLLDGNGNLAKVAELPQRALAIDGNMSSAWTAMSWLHDRCSNKQWRETEACCRSFSIEQARRLSEEDRLMALEIDPADAVAIAYGAFKRAFAANDWPGVAPEFERAVRLGPTQSDVLRSTILYALRIQRPQIAVHLARFAVARDPLCRRCIYFLARAYRNFDWTNPILRTVLQTPRGQALLREFGVADEQLAEIRFEPRLPGDP
jgi:hypothetical protein